MKNLLLLLVVCLCLFTTIQAQNTIVKDTSLIFEDKEYTLQNVSKDENGIYITANFRNERFYFILNKNYTVIKYYSYKKNRWYKPKKYFNLLLQQ